MYTLGITMKGHMSSVWPKFCDKQKRTPYIKKTLNTTVSDTQTLHWECCTLHPKKSMSRNASTDGESCCVGNDNFHWGRPYCADLRKHQHFICWYIAGWRAMNEYWRKEAANRDLCMIISANREHGYTTNLYHLYFAGLFPSEQV